ncbi:MAG: hypothetical protein ACOY33_13785 [Pseudomonadota bacterium]
MMTTKAYLLTWGLYLLSAGGLLLVLYRLTRGWRPVAFRIVLRAIVGVWLLVPMVVEPGAARETLAPAFVVLMFELMTGFEAAGRVLWPMLMITAAAIPAALAVHWSWSRWRANRPLTNVPRPLSPASRIEPTVGAPPSADASRTDRP